MGEVEGRIYIDTPSKKCVEKSRCVYAADPSTALVPECEPQLDGDAAGRICPSPNDCYWLAVNNPIQLQHRMVHYG